VQLDGLQPGDLAAAADEVLRLTIETPVPA
jgi:hypothetical protein